MSIIKAANSKAEEIEKLLDRRVNKEGKTEYKVKWKNYDLSEYTWESLEHLTECHAFDPIFLYEDFPEIKDKSTLPKDLQLFWERYQLLDDSFYNSDMAITNIPIWFHDKIDKILGIKINPKNKEEYVHIKWHKRKNQELLNTYINTKLFRIVEEKMYLDYLINSIVVIDSDKLEQNKDKLDSF